MAENPLSPQFQFGWHSKEDHKFKTKAEITQEKVVVLAAELQTKYFSANQESTRRVAAEMRAILTSVDAVCNIHEKDGVSFVNSVINGLEMRLYHMSCHHMTHPHGSYWGRASKVSEAPH